jgi:hypothetical protein
MRSVLWILPTDCKKPQICNGAVKAGLVDELWVYRFSSALDDKPSNQTKSEASTGNDFVIIR